MCESSLASGGAIGISPPEPQMPEFSLKSISVGTSFENVIRILISNLSQEKYLSTQITQLLCSIAQISTTPRGSYNWTIKK